MYFPQSLEVPKDTITPFFSFFFLFPSFTWINYTHSESPSKPLTGDHKLALIVCEQYVFVRTGKFCRCNK